MPKPLFQTVLNNHQVLVSDGATGTNLIDRGLPGGVIAENWVLDRPEMIIQLHRDFISAGADIVLTSTFNASSVRLRGSPLEGKVKEINQKAVELARQAAVGTNTYIAGSLGPLGQLLKPLGPLSIEETYSAYAEQAQVISESGADLLIIETQYDLGEIKAAIAGVLSVSNLPLVVSISYDRGKRTMMGVKPSQAANELDALPVDMIGINCGRSIDENYENLVELRQFTTKPIWFKPNAGLPKIDAQGKSVYETTPEQMADQVSSWLKAGALIVGGCCGTTPEHLRKISERVKQS